jgi:hypothetical protein
MNSTHNELKAAMTEKRRQKLFEHASWEASENLARFGDSDLALYEHSVNLMSSYRQTVGLYEQYHGDITSYEAHQIIDGIITVLVSRLREFEESSSAVGTANPVQEEKEAIIKAALAPLADREIPVNFAAYTAAMNSCRANLNDLDRRKQVQFYLQLMEEELEILATIIKIQVQALEQAAELDSGNVLEKIAIHKILSLLREAYQYYGKASIQIYDDFHNTNDSPLTFKSREEFETFLKEDDEKIGAIRNEISQEAEAVLSVHRLEYFKSVYRLRRQVSGEMMLADDMVRIFVKMYENWPKSENDILTGVAETIEIKIDSLRESISQMTAECNQIIDKFAADNPNPSEEEIADIKEEMWQAWLETEEGIQCIPFPFMSERAEKHEKAADRCKEAIEKRLLKFKRETLFYEISTYEEIIFYSVSRIRDDFPEAATLADECLSGIEVLLKKNNIEIIRPVPHDPFNSKEHEVLMAESKPEFKKGEIIKLMNSGYRVNGLVILRANVIAAR